LAVYIIASVMLT